MNGGISQFPAILGHEVTGRVTAMGPNGKGLKVGQQFGVGWNSGSCMRCYQCMSGSHNHCPQKQMTIVGHRGGFATHIRPHWAWVMPLPEKLTFADAGPLWCGAVIVVAPLAMVDFASRQNVLPQTEHFPMSKINEAFARLESGKAHDGLCWTRISDSREHRILPSGESFSR